MGSRSAGSTGTSWTSCGSWSTPRSTSSEEPMINPLRSEAEAFRFLIGTIVYFAAITIAVVAGGRWLGPGGFIVRSAIVLGSYAPAPRADRPAQTVPAPHAEGEGRLPLVGTDTPGGRT